MRVALDTAYQLKPPPYAQINRAHPLAQQLRGFWLASDTSNYFWDAVTGLPSTGLGTDPVIVPSAYGNGLSSATNLGWQLPLTRFIKDMYLLPCSVFALAKPNSTANCSIFSTCISNSTERGVTLFNNSGSTLGLGALYGGFKFTWGNQDWANAASFATPVGFTAFTTSSCRIYLNGIGKSPSAVASGSGGDEITESPVIGQGGGFTSSGSTILCVAMWARALSDAEHMQLAQQPFCMFNQRPMIKAA